MIKSYELEARKDVAPQHSSKDQNLRLACLHECPPYYALPKNQRSKHICFWVLQLFNNSITHSLSQIGTTNHLIAKVFQAFIKYICIASFLPQYVAFSSDSWTS
nr:hypothetical protein CFP56_72973 [Quercus suber]